MLTDSERHARRLSAEHRRALRAGVERAVATMTAADRTEDRQLRDHLAREALRGLIIAHALAHGTQPSPGTDERADGFDEALDALAPDLQPSGARSVLNRLRASEISSSPSDREYEESARLFARIESRIDVRSPREIGFLRVVRLSAAGIAAVAVLWLLLGSRNLALGRTVTTSSVCPSSPPAVFGKTPISRVVDGVRSEAMFAMCTNLDVHPWLTVDLGSEHALTKIVVYNRSDCCWGLDDLPLNIEVSRDNTAFVTVGTVNHPFTQDFPFSVHLARQIGRYVRLINPSNRPSNIVVNEVEIYGR